MTTKKKQWLDLKEQHGSHAYLRLLYKIHFDNGCTSDWTYPPSNQFVDDNLDKIEWCLND